MTQLLGWLATFLFTIAYVPQMYKTLKTKTVDGVSIFLFVLQFVANGIALVYAAEINQFPLIVKYILGLIFTFGTLSIFAAV